MMPRDRERRRLSDVLERLRVAVESNPYPDAGFGLPRQQRAERLHRSGIRPCLTDDDYQRITRQQCAPKPMRTHLWSWVQSRCARPVFVMSGPRGRGKTVAAGDFIAAEGGIYLPVEELVRVHSDRRRGAEVRRLAESRVLVLDDIGREPLEDSDAIKWLLTELVDRRRDMRCWTVITTNLGGKAFAARYPEERLISRLAQCCRWVTDAGEDMRRAT